LRARPTAYLSIVGFGPEKQVLIEQIQQLGLQSKVQFIGAVKQSDLPALYRRAAIFVSPFVQAISGDQEGLGLVTIEAAGCGCPVVTSDLPAVRDVFEVAQVQFVAPGSASALSEAVIALLATTPALDVTERVRASLCARFDWSIVVENYVRILRDIVDARLGND
jgi:glycosyltransferase involved in cell wall biosynthesis